MQQRDLGHLLDMLDSARLALAYVMGKSYEDFAEDPLLQDAVVRRITIIGEAARRLSADARNAISDIEWQEVIGMRNVLVHQYDQVAGSRLWEAIRFDLPRLVEILEPLVPPETPQGSGMEK